MLDSVTIIGVGLIGGSFSLALKDRGLVRNVIGVSRTDGSLEKALELGLIDEALPLAEAVKRSELIYVAIPVDATVPVMRQVIDLVTDRQIVADAGSTKKALCESLSGHPMRRRFVATHPMWGTEYSGPEAAVHNAFTGRTCVICEKEKSDPDAVKVMEDRCLIRMIHGHCTVLALQNKKTGIVILHRLDIRREDVQPKKICRPAAGNGGCMPATMLCQVFGA